MTVEQIYTGCLAEASYYIESNGEAAVIDPLRESFPYLERAEKDGSKIKFVFETHFHADFVSGHIDLAKKAGGQIVYGPNSKTGFEAIHAVDGQEFKVGDITIIAMHTPGHTLESTTWLLRDGDGKDHCIFTGDTLFIGDVGRPDLAQKMGELTQDDLAGMLFDSLRSKIMPLADEVIVYPAHGAGSACGKNMSSETSATLGDQKKFNYALRADMTRDEFINEVTAGLAPPPKYFPENVRLNKDGYAAIDEVMQRGQSTYSPQEFKALAASNNALIIDTRTQDEFPKGFIPGSIFIGLDGNFAPWVGALFPDVDRAILLITEDGKEEEAVRRLSRVGYDNCLGILAGGIEAWKAAGFEIDKIEEVETADFAAYYQSKDPSNYPSENSAVLDVRKASEYDSGHLEHATLCTLDFIDTESCTLDASKTYHIHCQSGYRSMIATSILKTKGYSNLVNIKGGFDALEQLIPMVITA